MKILFVLVGVFCVPAFSAMAKTGVLIDASWGKNNRNTQTTIIFSENDMLLKTDWDLTLKQSRGGSPMRIVRVPKSGGSKCISIKNIQEDIEWNRRYCVRVSKYGSQIYNISYSIASKVVDAAPDTLNRDTIIGKTYNENFELSLDFLGGRCAARLVSASASGPSMNNYSLASGNNAKCRVINEQ